MQIIPTAIKSGAAMRLYWPSLVLEPLSIVTYAAHILIVCVFEVRLCICLGASTSDSQLLGAHLQLSRA